jgi:hypothetical protein
MCVGFYPDGPVALAPPRPQVWACLCMMLLSAMVGAYTDLNFNWSGYGWQVANCLFTSAYALHLRRCAQRTQHLLLAAACHADDVLPCLQQ